jgi:hypothetical protein
MTAKLLQLIREDVIGLLLNRYVFRTQQEIARRNPWLHGSPRGFITNWLQTVYATLAPIGVRRLAGQTFKPGDVNLVRLLDIFIQDPTDLWGSFEGHYPNDAAKARAAISKKSGRLASNWERSACRRLISEDRKAVIRAAEKATHFASKRVAHMVPDVKVSTTFSQLDEAIDALTKITDKYTLLVLTQIRKRLRRVHLAGYPTMYQWLAQMENPDLLKEMKSRKLPRGWDSVFLEPWATPEIIALPLGDMSPPQKG